MSEHKIGDVRTRGSDWAGRPYVTAGDIFGALTKARETGDYSGLRRLAEGYAAHNFEINNDDSAHADPAIELLANPHRWRSPSL